MPLPAIFAGMTLAKAGYSLLGLAATLVAGHMTKEQIADHYEKEAGILSFKNRKKFEAEIEKLAEILRSREGKAELDRRGIRMEQLLLGMPDVTPPVPEGGLYEDGLPEEVTADLEPTGGLEVDSGALLADSLGVSRDQVKQATSLPVSPIVSLFGAPAEPPTSLLSGEGG